MSNTDPLVLAERIEKLNGPDREVDHAIYEAIGRPIVRLSSSSTYCPNLVNWAPFYTTSIDAAISLVPDGWQLHGLGETAFMIGGPWLATLVNHSLHYGQGGKGKSPALALTAAALRARASTLPGEEG